MTSERVEWVEIIEPRTKEHMYANLTTGDCVWDPPEGVNIKRTDNSQWWELFDTNTSRFYYYNVASQKTVWHRPQNCDIIPLAKLQTLKQNTDPSERRDKEVHSSRSKVSTSSSCGASATPTGTANRGSSGGDNHQRSSSSSGHARGHSAQDKYRNSDLLASPQGRQSLHHRFPTVEDGSMSRPENKFGRYGQQSTSSSSRNSQKYMESSDSSISSAHGYRRLTESGAGMVGGGGSLRMGTHSSGAMHNKKPSTDSSNHRMLQESSSSHNIPHISLPSPHHSQPSPHHQKLSYSASNSSDLAGNNSPSHSVSTPQLKKKLNLDKNGSSSREGAITKHQSFDYSGNPATISLIRSGSFMSSSGLTGSAARQYQMQRKGSFDGNGGSDDSMHEKYFKSVENTPVSRRRHTTSSKPSTGTTVQPMPMPKHSSDSSPQSPVSPKNSTNATKPVRPSVLPMESSSSSTNYKSSQKSDPDHFNMDVTSKPERYLDKMKLDKERITPIGGAGGPSNLISLQQMMKQQPPPNIASSHTQNEIANKINSLHRNASAHAINKEQYSLNIPNLERHNKDMVVTLEKKSTHNNSKSNKKKSYPSAGGTMASDVEFDNGNLSPLYSNWDQEMQEHLLPLQHYILEQAKLSGCYGFGDAFNDSDSFHSDSQSEHSFSGHEPDNEDSDHSDGRGDYLSHYPYDEYGATHRCNTDGGSALESYYNFDRNDDKEDISEEVEAKLESMQQDQIYSPVKNHPPLPKLPLFPPLNQKPFPKTNEQTEKELQTKRFINSHNLHQHQLQQQQQHQMLLQQQQQQQQHQQTQQKTQKINLLQRLQENLSSNSSNDKIAEMALLKECDIEKFAQDNLNLHSKGIFRKKSSIRDMLSWTSDAISRPMLSLARDKVGKKMATELFKLVQIYMGDRKARAGMSLNSVAMDIMVMTVAQPPLRDELYVQLCRQTTENPMRESLIRGWELMAICLAFIPPSPTFQPALLGYMNRHRDPTFATSFPEVGKWPIHVQISHYATIACRRLERIGSAGKKQAKKPTVDEINHAREQIFRDSMFGNTLTEVMELQKDKFPDRKLPWIQVTLSEQVLILNGKQTEGIFRVPADVDEVSLLKARLDKWEFPDNKELLLDAHAPASLLKLWYRELYDPLIPDELYEECVQTDLPEEAAKIIDKLPYINKLVLTYLIHFLQQFSLPDVVVCTKMDSSNLAMVFAPNLLRCTSNSPQTILENSRKEMAFVRTLIQHMDTHAVNKLK